VPLVSSARTHWEGDLASGSGVTTMDTGVGGEMAVSWKARTEEHGGLTSPEELIAAALSACFSMALSGGLARSGNPPQSMDTEASATFSQTDAGWRLTTMDIKVRANVPGLDADAFQQAAETAKDGCPVSQALKGNVQFSLDAALV
jgi:lipoyl-dependent peroxiredoxin